MNRLCICTGYGAGAAVFAALGLAVVSSLGFGDPTGRCCFPDGTCQVLTQFQCEGEPGGGDYQGDGTTCATPCGACCYVQPPTDCQNNGDCPTGETCVNNECTNTGGEDTCDNVTEADCTALGGAWQGAGVSCGICQITANCNRPLSNCQEPNIGQFPGGTILTATPTFDNFRASATTLDKVCFYGAYIDGAAAVDCDDAPNLADDVQVVIFNSQPGLPPTLGSPPVTPLFTFNPAPGGGVNATMIRRPTGFEFALGGFDAPVTEYEWTVDDNPTAPNPVLVNNHCYWMFIQNTVTSDLANCEWFWEISPERVLNPTTGDGDDRSLDRALLLACINAGGFPTVCANQTDNDFDMAWCLDFDLGNPADSSNPAANGCYLPIVNGCTEITCTVNGDCPAGVPCVDGVCNRGDCNVPDGTPGCNDPECCTLVCTAAALGGAGLGICCTQPWSQQCADSAIAFGCTPLPPCQPEENCQLVSTANAFNSTTATDPANDQFISADDFTPLANGNVNNICWYGIYAFADPANPNPDLFRIRYYADDDGKPGAVLATFTQGVNLTYDPGNPAHKKDSNLDLGGDPSLPIIVFSAQHANVPVTAGQCYWLEISNKIGDPDAMDEASSWFWEFAATSATPPLYSGNGRLSIDGSPPDGHDDIDIVAATDLSFCVGLEVTKPTCGLQTHYNTGPEHAVLFDGADGGNLVATFLGWSSGQLCLDNNGTSVPCGNQDAYPQRRTAQPFHLGPVAEGGTDHRIRYIYVSGFTVDAPNVNEDFNYAVYSRTGLTRPVEDDILVTGTMPFGAIVPVDNPEGGFGGAELFYFNTDFSLPGNADYWLTVFASNSAEGQLQPSNWAWFTAAHNGILNACPAAGCIGPTPEDDADPGVFACNPANCATTNGKPMLWRSRHLPDGAPGDPAPSDGFGYGSYSLSTLTIDWDAVNDPDGSPNNLYKAAFQLRGGPGGTCGNSVVEPGEQCDPPGNGCSSVCQTVPTTCPWDCDASGDGNVNVSDLLALLGQYDPLAPGVCDGGESCDYDGNGCVDVTDLLKLLAHYTTDPGGIGCP